jgi:3'-phosphoadenosine 5'-phosphosulfate sulfotransferase (PAPS reductase)/FAD synthetase
MNINDALLIKATDITENVKESLSQQKVNVVNLYRQLVDDIKQILTLPSKPIGAIANSHGKDSTLVLVATIAAYRELIASGEIEPDRLLVVASVDTLVDSLPMVMLGKYMVPRIKQYCKHVGINLEYSVLTPSLNDEYFVRWGGASKLLNNPTRSSDCTVILKTTTNYEFFNNLHKKYLGKQPIVTFTGQRNLESSRRHSNMQKQGVANKTNQDIEAELEQTESGILRYAPIRDWTTDDVFFFHEIAGIDAIRPITDIAEPIESCLPHHALLIELYGNGSHDTCSVLAGDKGTSSSGCGGRARYGCFSCLMVTEDKSSQALTRYPRWNVLGAENGLRVRDWMFRLSTTTSARAMHPKACDEVGGQRVAMQPNVLKARYLEKMAWYASQLAVDSQKAAAEFREFARKGDLLSHPGYADIYHDPFLSDKARVAMLDMYVACAKEPLFTTYSMKHATVQSMNWALLGVATFSFRPLAIWNDVANLGKRKPYPLLNSEWEAKFGKITLANNLPDAVMFPLLNKKREAAFNPVHTEPYLSLHERPVSSLNLIEDDMNCHFQERNEKIVRATNDNGKIKIAGRTLSDNAASHLLKELSGTDKTSFFIRNLETTAFQYYPRDCAIKATRRSCKTERVISRVAGKILRGNTRLKFYNPMGDVSHDTMTSTKPLVTMNFLNVVEPRYYLSTPDLSNYEQISNIHIDDSTYGGFGEFESWEDYVLHHALEIHDREFRSAFDRQSVEGRGRRFGSTYPIYWLLTQAGLSIKSHYQPTFEAMVKRTELYDQVGLLNLANKPHSHIQKAPYAISMNQHRQDKVKWVNDIRHYRNELRRDRHAMAAGDLKLIKERAQKDLELFAAHAVSALNVISAAARVNITEAQHHSELNIASKAQIAQLWLDMYEPEMLDAGKFISLVMPRELAKKFNESSVGISFNREHVKIMSALRQHSQDIVFSLFEQEGLLTEQINQMKERLELGPVAKDELICLWRNALINHYPQLNDFGQFSRSGYGARWLSRVESIRDKNRAYTAQIGTLCEKLCQAVDARKAKAVKNLSVIARVALLSKAS